MKLMTSLTIPTLAQIEAAKTRISPHIVRTPLLPAGEDKGFFLKAECLQPHGSFKLRAGLNAILEHGEEALSDGVVTASAGNFAQGLAVAAKLLGVPVTVIAPDNAAKRKIAALERMGARVTILSREGWWQVLEAGKAEGEPGAFIHPVADAGVIAGNASIGLEILEDVPEPGTVLVPFGGGGLISGIAAALRAKDAKTRVIGVETEAAIPLAAALNVGRPVNVEFDSSTFVDGMGARTVLASMWPLLEELVDGAVSVSTDEVRDAVRTLALDHGLVTEGAGAASFAAARSRNFPPPVVAILSGGNIDAAVLSGILRGV